MAASSAAAPWLASNCSSPRVSTPEMGAALGGAQEQRLGARGGVLQAILRPMGTGGALVGDQRRDMGRVLDLRAAIEAARVRGEHLLAVDDAHGLEAGEQRERARTCVCGML